jgi:hypothetical protein
VKPASSIGSFPDRPGGSSENPKRHPSGRRAGAR